MSQALTTMTNKLAQRLDMGVDGSSLIDTLKATAFKGQVTDAQMVALLVVANQYALNPWTKELYAFPDQNNGIVPVVGIDGWARIINSNENFDGMDFEQDDEKCTCIIYRKDRSHPIKVTEYMAECRRSVKPWQSHPRRMLRHKAMIQCARIAFGYVGIYDQDEAEVIAAAPAAPASGKAPRPKSAPPAESRGEVIEGEVVQEPGQTITEKHAKMLRGKLSHSGKTEGELCQEFEIDCIESLSFPNGLNDALAWITQ